jgi:hypothetical protein
MGPEEFPLIRLASIVVDDTNDFGNDTGLPDFGERIVK